MSNEIDARHPNELVEETDFQPLLTYLQSPQGHEIATRLLSVVEDVKKSTLEKTTSHAVFEKWLQAGIIFVVVVAASLLSYLGKFDTSLGVLFGTLVGYISARSNVTELLTQFLALPGERPATGGIGAIPARELLPSRATCWRRRPIRGAG